MSGRITSLTYKTDGKSGETLFEFAGDITLAESTTLIHNFQSVIGNYEFSDLPELNSDTTDTESDTENKQRENKSLEDTRSYSLNELKDHKNVLSSMFRNKGSIQIVGSTQYRVCFPGTTQGFPQIELRGGIPRYFNEYSYPVCSCPSYFYRGNSNGGCKHIEGICDVLEIECGQIRWDLRPENLPLLLKRSNVNEFQWIPAAAQVVNAESESSNTENESDESDVEILYPIQEVVLEQQ